MYENIGDSKIINHSTFIGDGGMHVTLGHNLYRIDPTCIRSGCGFMREGRFSGTVEISPTEDTGEYNDNHAVLGLQALFRSQERAITTSVNGTFIPHVYAGGSFISDSSLIHFMKHLEEQGMNIEKIKGLKFHGNKVYLFGKEDSNLIARTGDPSNYCQRVPLLPGVYMVLGTYNRKESVDGVSEADKENPLYESKLSEEDLLALGIYPDFRLEGIVDHEMSMRTTEEDVSVPGTVLNWGVLTVH